MPDQVSAVHPAAIKIARAIWRGTADGFAEMLEMHRNTLNRYESAAHEVPVLEETKARMLWLSPAIVERLVEAIRASGAEPVVVDGVLMSVMPRRQQ